MSTITNRLHDAFDRRFPASKIFEYEVRKPRFRGTNGSPGAIERVDHSTETCNLHQLCKSCQKVFSQSKIIKGSYFWISPKTETFTLHASILDLEQSVEQRCHFCTLAWEVLEDKEGSLKELVATLKGARIPLQTSFQDRSASVRSLSLSHPVQAKLESSSSSTGDFVIHIICVGMSHAHENPCNRNPRGMYSVIRQCR